ncbi:zinc-dependent alcohol dehydrogenase family protein [Aureimonas phyllosphaerae]|uniref:Alcohol dehydrogenase n=1 Tax=Aureimonas phyllosphaerae TaxID=1166078 RepID=A0A7W6BS02_9HYPH|nr:zinc-dependent alcohol dehydrogenase family protein [Aureimonas phyllosphaerae]MBB3935225.1 alcohol dehydrogenase [Aureimonas phyllosphaerae]MBB3959233.1 alcohol dehydrogenase [Aureimonas phyllosphaerae]SFF06119.1 alcohol dehydrogenase [Aureimonas phyllosphaerae]
MKAMIFETFGTEPDIRQVPDPTPAPDGVVIEVMATGLCRSDWHGWMGHDADIRLPHVPGHEFAGVVAAVGRDVRGFRPGERVTVPFIAACGHCRECYAGHQQVCEAQFQPGFTHWGSFAEFVAIERADNNLVRLPESMDFRTAASLGCRFATSFRAVVDQGRVRGGEWVAVHGAGGVGLSAVMIASALGARVVAIDVADHKLELARKMGATATVNSREVPAVVEAVRDITGGGAHVSLDALGHPETCFNSIANLRRRGRHVQVGLMLADNAKASIPMAQVIAHELEIYGSHGMQSWRYDAMLEMILAGSLRPDRLIGETLSLEAAVPALVAMGRSAPDGIAMIDPKI